MTQAMWNATVSENDHDLPAEIGFQRWSAQHLLSSKCQTPEGHRHPNNHKITTHKQDPAALRFAGMTRYKASSFAAFFKESAAP